MAEDRRLRAIQRPNMCVFRYMTTPLKPKQIEAVFQRLETLFPSDDPRPPTVKEDADLFRALVGCLLSAQSRDANTLKAKTQLFARADTPAEILALSDNEVAAAIKPCGLYNMKTRNLKKLCRAILDTPGGRVPRDRSGLMALPGIGRKCADIMLLFSYGEPVIAVDTHVHRVCNRLGLASGKTEAETARDLDARAPAWAKLNGHMQLLDFGKQICRARAPRCATCILASICNYSEKRV